MARKHNIARFHRFYKVITRERVCVYCGVRATTTDHFVPISVVAILRDAMDYITGLALVPSCGECNSFASDSIFPTIAAKRRFIQNKIRRKYAGVLAMPHWQAHELAEVGYALQHHILSGMAQKEWVIQRLQWKNSMTSEPVLLAKLRSNLAVSGRNTVARHAPNGGIT